jgi:hypothetical protein
MNQRCWKKLFNTKESKDKSFVIETNSTMVRKRGEKDLIS